MFRAPRPFAHLMVCFLMRHFRYGSAFVDGFSRSDLE